MENRSENRLYSDLAWLWPHWGDMNGEYSHWCNHVTDLMHRYARRPLRTLLNMGCGGGKNVFNLKRNFDVTGIDISDSMLDLAKQLNPDCTFIKADMRRLDLGIRFDAVLIDDAISYMTRRDDLEAVFKMADRHLLPGGVMVVTPDVTKESFVQNRTQVTHSRKSTTSEELEIVFIENNFDPDTTDCSFEGLMVYLIRERGELRIETDRHILGLYELDEWHESLVRCGLQVYQQTYPEHPGELPVFVCVKSELIPG